MSISIPQLMPSKRRQSTLQSYWTPTHLALDLTMAPEALNSLALTGHFMPKTAGLTLAAGYTPPDTL